MPAFLPSEMPVRARTRHHWIVLLRPPHKLLILALVVLVIAAIAAPKPMLLVLGLVLAVMIFLRFQTWHAEWVILTGKRIIRVQGVPETTSSEASLRLDRISGARLVQTVPGKILGYGTIELEAPGDHPGLRRLTRIARPELFYLQLRGVLFGEPRPRDSDDDPRDFVTQPLPPISSERDRFGRRRR